MRVRALVLVVQSAALLDVVIAAWVLHPESFVRGLLTRAKAEDARWRPFLYEEVRDQPPPGISLTALRAHQRIMRIASEYLGGALDVQQAAELAAQTAVSDPDNGLTRWCAAWLSSEAARLDGADPPTRFEALRASLAAPPGPARFATYEREERARWTAVLGGHVKRPDVAAQLAPSSIASEQFLVAPAMVDLILSLSDDLSAAGRAAEAGECRSMLARLLAGLLSSEPTPATALMCSDLVQRLGAAPTASGPAAAIVERAAAFRRDGHAALEQYGKDVLDHDPVPDRAAYALTVGSVAGALLLTIGGLVVGVLGCAYAVGSAFAAAFRARSPHPAAASSGQRTRRRGHAEPSTAVALPDSRGPVGWGGVIARALLIVSPAVIAACAISVHVAGRGLSYADWTFVLGIVTPVACACLWAGLGRRPVLRVALAAGLLPALYPIAPLNWTSRTERLVLDALGTSDWAGPWLARAGIVLLLTLVGLLLWAGRARVAAGDDRREQRRTLLGTAVFAWLASGVVALALYAGHRAADARYTLAFVQQRDRVAALVGEDWRTQYFGEFLGSAGDATPP